MPYYTFDTMARIDKISKDPYKYLLTFNEESTARAYIPRGILMFGLCGLLSMRRLKMIGQLARKIEHKSMTGSIYSSIWRGIFGLTIGYCLGRKLFLDKEKLFEHACAKDEIRKIMRTKPNAKKWSE